MAADAHERLRQHLDSADYKTTRDLALAAQMPYETASYLLRMMAKSGEVIRRYPNRSWANKQNRAPSWRLAEK